MAEKDGSIFRQAALDRLASPERLDTRPRLPAYKPILISAVIALLVAAALFAVWLR